MTTVAETTKLTTTTESLVATTAQVVSRPAIQVDEARIHGHLDGIVQGTIEESLNALLDAEADQLCGAKRYQRSEAPKGTRTCYYHRTLQTGV